MNNVGLVCSFSPRRNIKSIFSLQQSKTLIHLQTNDAYLTKRAVNKHRLHLLHRNLFYLIFCSFAFFPHTDWLKHFSLHLWLCTVLLHVFQLHVVSENPLIIPPVCLLFLSSTHSSSSVALWKFRQSHPGCRMCTWDTWFHMMAKAQVGKTGFNFLSKLQKKRSPILTFRQQMAPDSSSSLHVNSKNPHCQNERKFQSWRN